MPDFTSDWVQNGELGFAFIVVILCGCLIFYVVRNSERREQKLLDALMQSNAQLTNITAVIQQLKNELAQRLDLIENTLKLKKRL